jgi:Putative zinc-finger
MGTCRQMRELMAGALYDDLDQQQRETLDRHLRTCSACARRYRQMGETLGMMSLREVPERDEIFWASYYDRLAPRLESPGTGDRPSPAEAPPIRRLAWNKRVGLRVAAAAVLVLVGILMGRWIWRDGPAPQSASSPTASVPHQDRILASGPAARAESYLQESKVLLLALANFDPDTDNTATLSFPTQKRISETLVQEAVHLKSELTDTAEMRLRELVDDLEVILLQIANIEDEHDLEAIEMVQSGVTKQGLLFRIDLSQLSRQVSDPPPSGPSQTKDAPTI